MPQASPRREARLVVRRIRVRAGKLDLEVEVPLAILHVDAAAAERVLRVLPNLARHVCVNGRGETFGDELVGTELAHLLEHVIIELQGQALRALARAAQGAGTGEAPDLAHVQLGGHTSWADELARTAPLGIALMRTTVTFQNDLVALQATKDACQIVNWAVCAPGEPEDTPDVSRMVASLCRMMAF